MRRGRRLAILAITAALALAGCASQKKATPPPVAQPGQAPEEPQATPPATTPPPATTTPAPPSPTLGTVTAPWDTAARSREARRNHVYPRGESALGRKLVEALPDPAGMTPSEGGPPPTPIPPWTPAPGDTTTSGRECWQAQLLVTSDRARAERVKSEAEALLGVPAVVVTKDGGYRVRAGGCLDTDAAMRLVERARAERWPEAFRVREGA